MLSIWSWIWQWDKLLHKASTPRSAALISFIFMCSSDSASDQNPCVLRLREGITAPQPRLLASVWIMMSGLPREIGLWLSRPSCNHHESSFLYHFQKEFFYYNFCLSLVLLFCLVPCFYKIKAHKGRQGKLQLKCQWWRLIVSQLWILLAYIVQLFLLYVSFLFHLMCLATFYHELCLCFLICMIFSYLSSTA